MSATAVSALGSSADAMRCEKASAPESAVSMTGLAESARAKSEFSPMLGIGSAAGLLSPSLSASAEANAPPDSPPPSMEVEKGAAAVMPPSGAPPPALLRSSPPPYAASRSPRAPELDAPQDGEEDCPSEPRLGEEEKPPSPPPAASAPFIQARAGSSAPPPPIGGKSGKSSFGGLLDVIARSAMNTPR